MIKELHQLKKENLSLILPIFLIIFFPISLLLGSAIINISTIILSIFFLYESLKNKNFSFINNFYFKLLFIFFLSLIINIFFSNHVHLDFSRQIGFLRFIFFVFALDFFLNYQSGKFKNFIFKSWFIIFIIVTFDLLFEFIFGFNSLGFKSYMPGRLAGFLGEELKIGNYYFGFILLSISYLFYNNKKYKFNLLIIISFLIMGFLIGERSNFIKIFLSISIFLFFLEKPKFQTKLLSLLSVALLIILITIFNQNIKTRALQILEPVKDNGIINYIKNSHYGAHYHTAISIFNNNKLFGVGLKQFRYESNKTEYDENKNNIYNRDNWSTHPHQIHFEILSETGIFGYLIFIFFFISILFKSIKNYQKKSNKYLLSSIIFIIISLLPLLPSGSFFTTFSASIFWLNFGVMLSLQNEYKKKR